MAAALLVLLLAAAAQAETLEGFDLSNLTVERDLLVAGGPGRDGIKAVDEPGFVPAEAALWVKPDTPVLGVALEGHARAYPVHVLEFHQVVNDEIGGVPVVVSWDPIAGAPRAHRRKLGDRTLRFGVSGLLYNAGFLMFDRETESLWSQWDGRAVAGPLAGKTLPPLRVRQEVMAVWLARHPETEVLERPMPRRIDYRYSPFQGYWVANRVPFPVKAKDDTYHAKEVVTGVVVDGKARAYLGSILTGAGGRAEDEVAGKRVEIAYDTNTATFTWEAPEDVRVREAYWFAWKAWHPETDLWGAGE